MESNDDADADANNIFPQLILILVLTVINAFFAMSEMAVIACNKTKIELLSKEGNKKAIMDLKLNENQTNFFFYIGNYLPCFNRYFFELFFCRQRNCYGN